jgi:hypothetical protein
MVRSLVVIVAVVSLCGCEPAVTISGCGSGLGSGSSIGEVALSELHAYGVVEARVTGIEPGGCDEDVATFEAADVVWQQRDIVIGDGTTEKIPQVPRTFTADLAWQVGNSVTLPSDVVVWVVYGFDDESEELVREWEAELVLDAETLEAFPPHPDVADIFRVDRDLDLLYRKSEDTHDERVAAQVAFVQEQAAVLRARNSGQPRPRAPRSRALARALRPPKPPSHLDSWRAEPPTRRSLAEEDRPAGTGLRFMTQKFILLRAAGLEQRFGGVGFVNDSGLAHLQAIQPEIEALPVEFQVVRGEQLRVALYDSNGDGVARWLGTIPWRRIRGLDVIKLEINVTSISTTAASTSDFNAAIDAMSQ